MDTSKEYIKMCEKAEEIQHDKLKDGDYIILTTSYCGEDNEDCSKEKPCIDCLDMCNGYLLTGIDKLYFGTIACVCDYKSKQEGLSHHICNCNQSTELTDDIADNSIWLPRQDQLQGMANMHCPYSFDCESLGKFCGEYGFFDSWEQLWLSFMMKKIYKKTWNKTEWESTE